VVSVVGVAGACCAAEECSTGAELPQPLVATVPTTRTENKTRRIIQRTYSMSRGRGRDDPHCRRGSRDGCAEASPSARDSRSRTRRRYRRAVSAYRPASPIVMTLVGSTSKVLIEEPKGPQEPPLRSLCGPACREQPGTGENSRREASAFTRVFPRVPACARSTNVSGRQDLNLRPPGPRSGAASAAGIPAEMASSCS
jgi:hypothetical protein